MHVRTYTALDAILRNAAKGDVDIDKIGVPARVAPGASRPLLHVDPPTLPKKQTNGYCSALSRSVVSCISYTVLHCHVVYCAALICALLLCPSLYCAAMYCTILSSPAGPCLILSYPVNHSFIRDVTYLNITIVCHRY
jgi:hypothetical protein